MVLAVLIFGFPLIGMVVGAWQVRRGVSGIAIDDHPCCGRCGYDLVHVASSAPCPECGGPPDSPRRIGNRVRQPRRITIGLALCCLSALFFSTGVYRLGFPGSFRSFAPLSVIRVEARSGSLPAIDEIARRIRSRTLSSSDIAVLVDEALAKRHADWVGLRAAWGDVIDAGLSSSALDQARTQRCFDEAVGVIWSGTSDLFKAVDGRSVGSDLLFVFAPAVGPGSTIAFDADIESALLDGSELAVGPKETGVYYYHVRNSAALDTFVSVGLPAQVSGKSLIVRWRIKIKDATTGTPLAEDWVHTETIAIPATGDGFLFGGRHRE